MKKMKCCEKAFWGLLQNFFSRNLQEYLLDLSQNGSNYAEIWRKLRRKRIITFGRDLLLSPVVNIASKTPENIIPLIAETKRFKKKHYVEVNSCWNVIKLNLFISSSFLEPGFKPSKLMNQFLDPFEPEQSPNLLGR